MQTQSKFGKNFKEIELTYETATCKIYTLLNSEDEIAIKIPKPVHEGDKKGYLDLIFETQLLQFLRSSGSDMAPRVHEEIILLNPDTKTIVNYVTIMDYPASKLISMLAGP